MQKNDGQEGNNTFLGVGEFNAEYAVSDPLFQDPNITDDQLFQLQWNQMVEWNNIIETNNVEPAAAHNDEPLQSYRVEQQQQLPQFRNLQAAETLLNESAHYIDNVNDEVYSNNQYEFNIDYEQALQLLEQQNILFLELIS